MQGNTQQVQVEAMSRLAGGDQELQVDQQAVQVCEHRHVLLIFWPCKLPAASLDTHAIAPSMNGLDFDPARKACTCSIS